MAGRTRRALDALRVCRRKPQFYKGSIREGLEDGRRAAHEFPGVHFLENDTITINGVAFIGATLWTDYRIEGHQQLAMSHARERMNDYRQIAPQRKPWQRFVPEAAARMHQASRRFIENALSAASIPIVVVTHHLPHAASLPDRFKGDLLNAAYASDLTEIIQSGRPALWVHGHTHDSCDHVVGDTRIICNPRGYGDENERFWPAAGFVDTEIRCLTELESGNAKKEVQPRVQA